jgi:DNA (cytosine-5)-methyltransferase 1
VDDASGAGLEGQRRGHPAEGGRVGTVRSVAATGKSRLFDPWANPDWLPCRDGKARPVEPGTFPLAHGAPARVGRLRAYGNAIVPQVAAGFVRAFMEATS